MTRLLSLDYDPVYGDEATRSTFSGDRSIFDFDVVIWDPLESFRSYLWGSQFRGLPRLSAHESVRFKAHVARRREEFADFVNSGKVLIVVGRPPQECYATTGEVTYSGTGRNRRTTEMLAKVDLLAALPTKHATQFKVARGDRIEVLGDGPLSALLRKYLQYLSYNAVLTGQPGAVIGQVHTAANRPVAIQQVSKGGGVFAVIPVPAFPDACVPEDGEEPYDEDAEYSPYDDEVAAAFQQDLLEAVAKVAGVRGDDRPGWAQSYRTQEQRDAQARVVAQQQAVEAARAELSKAESDVAELEAPDQLYLGSGRALELEVRAVLELLGGTVTEPEPGRDDWRVSFPEGDAVVEVKGVGKSAAEKHAAQLEKWVASAITDDGKAPKGILVVNTWRGTPLDRRTEADFPDQMLPYCKAREHCLVTGLQLFAIRSEVTADPDTAKKWREKLLNTKGKIMGVKRWTSVLKQDTNEAESKDRPDRS